MQNRASASLVAATFALAGILFAETSAFADHDDIPAFCRSGEGHPVFGPRWCIEKGFGLGRRRDFFARSRPFPGVYDSEDWKEAEKRAREREREYWKSRREDEREWAKHRREMERESRKHFEELEREERKHRHDFDRDARFEPHYRTFPEGQAEPDLWQDPRELDRRAAEEIEQQRRTLADERSRREWEEYERY